MKRKGLYDWNTFKKVYEEDYDPNSDLWGWDNKDLEMIRKEEDNEDSFIDNLKDLQKGLQQIGITNPEEADTMVREMTGGHCNTLLEAYYEDQKSHAFQDWAGKIITNLKRFGYSQY